MPNTLRFAIAMVLLSAGCGARSDAPPPVPAPPPAADEPATEAPAPEAIEAAVFAPLLSVDLKSSTKTASGLYYRDIVPGTGTTVQRGMRVSVHYAGWLTDGTPFDQNGAGEPPYTFTPGQGEVIPGWEEGVVGMKVGGKRQLILPPTLGYGAGGSGPIPPNAILVFTVDVVSAN